MASDRPHIKQAFPPSVAADARVLILGSLPGDASIAHGQYYAHPSNGFWRLVGAVIGEALADVPYAERLARLKTHRIALWDVIGSAERRGSLDAAIRAPRARDLAAFAAELPDLRAIAFNGATAARHGRRSLAATHVPLFDLPSSSAAYAALSFDAKRAQWLALRAYL